MKKEIAFWVVLALMLVPIAWADENSTNRSPGVKVNGVLIDMANDRKVDTVGGIAQPEDLSRYVQRKVNGVSDQVVALQNKVNRLEEQMNNILVLLNNNRASRNNGSSQGSSQNQEDAQRNQLV